jgi:hypothetical protein
MKFTVISSPRAQHQISHQTAMGHGLNALGVDVVYSHHHAHTEHVAVWGWRRGQMLRDQGHQVLVMERGYLGDRFAWTSLGWNGLNGHAVFPQNDDPSRFAKHFSLKPWQEHGQYVLLCGQVPGDASLKGKDMMPWYSDVAMKAANAYEMPVMFRPHPMAIYKGFKQTPKFCEVIHGTLEGNLANAAVCIAYNSNTSVDAVIAGVPALTFDHGSMAWEVSAHRIGELHKPHREAWAHRLAWKQWSLAEIQTGEALKPLLEMESAYG